MRLLIAAIIFLFFCSSCKIQAPEFRRVENTGYKIDMKEGMKVQTEIVLYNPNRFRFKIKEYNADVYADGKKVASLNESCNVKVKPGKEFRIPVKAVIKPEMNLLDGLKSLFKAAAKKEFDLGIKGKVSFKWLLYKKDVKIDVSQKVKLD